jgi:hypothetical protein
MTDELPSENDRLFCESDDWWNNACLNFTHDGLYLYAYGYKEAADILAASIIETRRKNDVLVHPIAFCYRHYLELSFKSILIQCHKLLDMGSEPPQGHRINDLWATCVPLIEQISPGECSAELKEITRLVGEFSKTDPFATAFRYPEDLHGNTSLSGLKLINIRNLAEVMNKIDIIVHGLLSQFSEYLSIKAEIERSS